MQRFLSNEEEGREDADGRVSIVGSKRYMKIIASEIVVPLLSERERELESYKDRKVERKIKQGRKESRKREGERASRTSGSPRLWMTRIVQKESDRKNSK